MAALAIMFAALVAACAASSITLTCSQTFTTAISADECTSFLNAVASANAADAGTGVSESASCSGSSYTYSITGTGSGYASCGGIDPTTFCSAYNLLYFSETPSGAISASCSASTSSCFPAHATVQLQVCMILIVLVHASSHRACCAPLLTHFPLAARIPQVHG